jgi:hypothetical protein
MAPAAITAAFNLPVHDAEHDRLQAELNEVRHVSLTIQPCALFSGSV